MLTMQTQWFCVLDRDIEVFCLCLHTVDVLPDGWVCVVTGEGKSSGGKYFKACKGQLLVMCREAHSIVDEVDPQWDEGAWFVRLRALPAKPRNRQVHCYWSALAFAYIIH